MIKDVGVGLIGLGVGQAAFAVNADPESRLQVVAVCDTNAEKARAVADRHGLIHVTTDHVDLVTNPEVQVVAVFSPDHLHYEHVMAALASNKHVVCAKPMGVSLEEAIAIADDVDERQVKLLAGQACRWRRDFVGAKALHANGDIGEVRMAEAHYAADIRDVLARTPWRWQQPQDLVHGGLSHPIDLLRWFCGEVVEVHAYAQNSGMDPRYTHAPDNFVVNLRFASGALGRVLGLFGCVAPPIPELGLSLFGTKGTLVNERVVLDRVAGRPTMTFQIDETPDGHKSEIHAFLRHFEDCLLNNRKPLVDHWDGARTVAACAAVATSLRTGMPARVQPLGPKR